MTGSPPLRRYGSNSRSTLGTKTTRPMITEITAATKTAPAAISFINPASSWYDGDTRSTNTSIAVFINSETNTNPTAITTSPHSIKLSFKKIPAVPTIIIADPCIQMLCWVLKAAPIPLAACPKLLILCSIENFFPISS
jgi:hypothetical protein